MARLKSVFYPLWFSLIELLVVIAIISVLMSIMLPALNKARETTRKIACSANMKQLGVAAFMCADDNDGALPPNPGYVEYLGEIAPYWGHKNYVGSKAVWEDAQVNTAVGICPSAPYPPDEDAKWRDDSSAYDPGLHNLTTTYQATCLEHDEADIQGRARWGGWMVSVADVNGDWCRKWKKLNSITPGSIILAEASWNRLNWSLAIPGYPIYPDRWQPHYWTNGKADDPNATAPAWRHQQSGNFLFVDGHVDSLKLRTSFNVDFVPE